MKFQAAPARGSMRASRLAGVCALPAIGFFLVLLCLTLFRVAQLNGGAQVYTLDDPYIHLAIAKNLVLRGSYGVVPGEFGAASSSVLWPFFLAFGMKLAGMHTSIPLVLNVIFCVLLLLVADYGLAWNDVPVYMRCITLCVAVIAVPLLPLALTGLEHSYHCFVSVATLAVLSRYIRRGERGFLLLLCLCALLLTTARYEAAFEGFAVAVVLGIRRQFRWAMIVLAAAACPIVLFGLFSIAHPGAYFLPNSLIVKAVSGGISRHLNVAFANLRYFTLHLVGLGFAVIVWLAYRQRKGSAELSALDACVLVTAISWGLHLLLAGTGQAGRYEAYLVAMFLFCGAIAISEMLASKDGRGTGEKRFAAVISAVLLLLLIPRGAITTLYVFPTIEQIYLQQYQMARLISRSFPETPVATNDIGVVDFMTNATNLDLIGLGSNDIAAIKRRRVLTAADMEKLAVEHKVKIVAIYRGWFQEIPESWTYAASITPRCPGPHFTIGGSTIAFFVTNPSDKEEVRQKMYAFQPFLPEGAKITAEPDSLTCLPR